MQPPLAKDEPPRVVVLYVGKREPHHSADQDIWDVLHNLLEVTNPVAGHDRPPCCEGGLPRLQQDELDSFLRRLRRLRRGR
jgi:hypothetical protein